MALLKNGKSFKIMNPNLSEDECREKLDRIDKEKLNRQKLFTEESDAPDTENPEPQSF